ncbi:hypothetical protein TNCV_2598271 [Trichonephila clavipes]|nr:hypothetical protein TNCV_2598271 [Trichonephila clavipes]
MCIDRKNYRDDEAVEIHRNSNSVAQQPMKARAYCVHPSISDYWLLRCKFLYSCRIIPDYPKAPPFQGLNMLTKGHQSRFLLCLGVRNENLKSYFRNSRNFAAYCRSKVKWLLARVPRLRFSFPLAADLKRPDKPKYQSRVRFGVDNENLKSNFRSSVNFSR